METGCSKRAKRKLSGIDTKFGLSRLRGRTVERMGELAAIVTGASSGIGAATAECLADFGFRMVLVARRRDRLESLAAGIRSKGGIAHVIEADIANQDDARRAVSESIKIFGRLDVLVNNAGLMLLGSTAEAPLDEWQRMIAINLNGLLYVTHAALPHLIEAAKTSRRGTADIVNISSVTGRRTFSISAVYGLTKHGIVGLTGGMRQELKSKNVRLSVVEPGLVETELPDHSRSEIQEEFKRTLLSIERLQARDIAEVILFIVTRPRHVVVDEIMVTPMDAP